MNSTFVHYDPLLDENLAPTYLERLGEHRLWIWAFGLQNAMLLSKKLFDWQMVTPTRNSRAFMFD